LLVYCIPTVILLRARVPFSKRYKAVSQIIHGILYALANTLLFVEGIVLEFSGQLPEKVAMLAYTHEGSADYGIWKLVFGGSISKIVAGNNLLDFPVFRDVVKMTCITTNRKPGESNVKPMREIKECIVSGIPVGIGPNGRERRSDNGVLKEYHRAAFECVDEVVPVLVLGTGAYKPPMKREPLAKPWWKFQWYASPRKVKVIIMDVLKKDVGESGSSFAKRTHAVMTERKRQELQGA
jgi:hypothetical protein